MMDCGLWPPRKLRSATIYQPRNRRHCVGELIQIDGSDHRWFEDRAPACALLVHIDDAATLPFKAPKNQKLEPQKRTFQLCCQADI